MAGQVYNPIESVDGVAIPCPAQGDGYQWSLNDISDSDAGRCESGKMHKNRIAQKVKLELKWRNVSIADGATILTAFNPEYFNVKYLDAMSGTMQTKRFYRGDPNAGLYSFNPIARVWTEIAFNIIEQ